MDAPFEVGDIVVCVMERTGYVQEGNQYVVTLVRHDEVRSRSEWYVQLAGVVGTHRADRFEPMSSSTYTYVTPVIRKIKQLEARFQQRVAR